MKTHKTHEKKAEINYVKNRMSQVRFRRRITLFLDACLSLLLFFRLFRVFMCLLLFPFTERSRSTVSGKSSSDSSRGQSRFGRG